MSAALEAVFDVATTEEDSVAIVDVPDVDDQTVDTDYAFSRKMQYELLTQGQAAINTSMRIAAESENPRAIEVLSGLLKNVSDMNRQLVNMAKDRAEAKLARAQSTGQVPTQGQMGTVNNTAVFVGSSADVNKMIAEKMKALAV